MALNPLHHPGARGKPTLDVEKAQSNTTVQEEAVTAHREDSSSKSLLVRCNAWVEGLAGLEARGITRVLPEEKHGVDLAGYIQMFALWFGMNLSVIFLVTGLLGPLVFQLGWVDCVCLVIFANALASAFPAYTATFGPSSGHRSMILGRYFMGYWPAKLACLLNIIMQTGWGIIACIIGGQIISAVNGDGLSIALGCAVAALCVGVLAIFGIAVLHILERYVVCSANVCTMR